MGTYMLVHNTTSTCTCICSKTNNNCSSFLWIQSTKPHAANANWAGQPPFFIHTDMHTACSIVSGYWYMVVSHKHYLLVLIYHCFYVSLSNYTATWGLVQLSLCMHPQSTNWYSLELTGPVAWANCWACDNNRPSQLWCKLYKLCLRSHRLLIGQILCYFFSLPSPLMYREYAHASITYPLLMVAAVLLYAVARDGIAV